MNKWKKNGNNKLEMAVLLASLSLGGCAANTGAVVTPAAGPTAVNDTEETSSVSGAFIPNVGQRNLQKMSCFEASYLESDEKACCEPSAGVYDGSSYLYIATDKYIPDQKSSMMIFDKSAKRLGTVDVPLINRMQKIEAISRTPDQKWVVASSAFSYYEPTKAKYNRHNMLVAWPTGKPEEAQLLFPSLVDGEESSIKLNDAMRAALVSDTWREGPPYFKIEGMTITSDNKILVGVREQGAEWDNFNYSRTILAMDYKIENDKFVVSGVFNKVVELETPEITDTTSYPAVSDLAFDATNNILYVLTSFEGPISPCPWSATENDFGGMLFWLPYDKLAEGKLRFVESFGEPVKFNRKSEGLAILNDKLLMVIYDDDRDLGKDGFPQRQKNEFFSEYLLLK